MSSGYVIPIDPLDFSRFPSYDPRETDDEIGFDSEDDEDEDEESLELSDEEIAFLAGKDFRDQIEPLLEIIPDREADIIFLYFMQGKRQADIAEIFNMTQAAVSYRLARGIKRIRFLLEIPRVTEDQLREDLPGVFPSQIDVDILVGMWTTTCQSEVAERLGLTQGRVRHRFFKAVERLKEAAEANAQYEPYSKIFVAISSKKFNILREVKLPQWADRGGDECL